MLVREVMTKEPVTVRVDAHVKEALRLLDLHSITALPVVADDLVIVGVLSEADLIRDRVLPDVRSSILPHHASHTADAIDTVGGVMSPRAITISEAADVAEAADLMTSTGVKSLPVVDDGHRLVGVLSRRDIVHALARLDADVERDVNALFESLGQSWLATADEGSIVITGPVGQKERALARAAASTVAGVVQVRFSEDTTGHLGEPH
ncbi:MAG TPA: CBS domain-containing protein [Nocardioidaceae bacterium]|jgi:CBS domain-containing protein|nr:CBS domain-containing protein [Nocardioidaceae bacterium]